jgi:hypothetical protein
MPGVAPRSDDHLVSAVLDLAPTLYDVAGISSSSDGISLMPLLEDPATPWRNELFFEKYTASASANAIWVGLRQDNWKYVEYWDGTAELYDLAGDPFELENRADDPAHAEDRARLAGRVNELIGLAIKPLIFKKKDGEVGQDYFLRLEPWGGEPPFEWTVETGQLPPGLSLDPAAGLISGTPSAAGSWSFSVRVTSSDLATQAQKPKTFVSPKITIPIS